MSDIPATQHAIQIVGVDEFVLNPAKPVDEVGPHQMLLKVEACGICFSDTKLLHAFDSHPRKAEVIRCSGSGMSMRNNASRSKTGVEWEDQPPRMMP